MIRRLACQLSVSGRRFEIVRGRHHGNLAKEDVDDVGVSVGYEPAGKGGVGGFVKYMGNEVRSMKTYVFPMKKSIGNPTSK